MVQDGILTLVEAIRKLTSFPAQVLGFTDRGVLNKDMIADLLIFDPRSVHARSTYPDPLQLAEGFDVVVVNGKIARENGRQAAELFGRVLAPDDDHGTAMTNDQ